VIHKADQKSLAELARESKGIIERARAGKFRSDDLMGGTFTVSNLGMLDVEHFVAIITPRRLQSWRWVRCAKCRWSTMVRSRSPSA